MRLPFLPVEYLNHREGFHFHRREECLNLPAERCPEEFHHREEFHREGCHREEFRPEAFRPEAFHPEACHREEFHRRVAGSHPPEAGLVLWEEQ